MKLFTNNDIVLKNAHYIEMLHVDKNDTIKTYEIE